MKRGIIFLILFLLVLSGAAVSHGQEPVIISTDTLVGIAATSGATVTPSAEASASAEATSSARQVVERVVETKSDITEPEGEVKGKLEQYLADQPVRPLSITNFVQHAIREAVRLGVPANTIVLVILFPVIAAVIAAARHLIGLRGFGIFVPAVLSVAFVATGLVVGIVMFLVILAMAMLARKVLKRLKLQYLPRMALLMWFVSVGVLLTLLLAPQLKWDSLMTISIFPILILMLLGENFIEAYLGKSRREATELTLETIVLALVCSLILSLASLQRFAILHPELLLAFVFVFDVFVGRYVGLRYSEYTKFKKMLKS